MHAFSDIIPFNTYLEYPEPTHVPLDEERAINMNLKNLLGRRFEISKGYSRFISDSDAS